jgi:SAM-dependent methyltransferase/ABC-type transporter Mla subunit MlaD
VNSRSSNTNSSAVDRDAEEQLLQHISALHARLSVSVEKLVAPLRDQIIAYKEVVAPLSQDLKKNLAVSWPLIEELQKQDGALQVSIGELKDNISRIDQGIEAFGSANQAGGEAINQLSARLDDVSGTIQSIVEKLESNQQTTTETTDQLLQKVVESQDQFTAAISDFGANQATLRADIESFAASVQNEVAGVSQSVAALNDTAITSMDIGFGELKAELDGGVSLISQAIASLGAASKADGDEEFESLKFEVQSGISMIYSDIAKLREAVSTTQTDNLDAVQSGLAGLQESVTGQFDHTAEKLSVLAAQISDLQSKDDTAQVDEARAQISKLDWAIQSIGQNIAALGNKLASVQEDVANPPMARRTLKSIEDVDHQVGQILRVLDHGPANLANANQNASVAPSGLEDVHTEIGKTQSLLLDIGGQLSEALKHYSRDIQEAVSQPPAPLPGVIPVATQYNHDARLAALETSALQQQGWLSGYDKTPPAALSGYDGKAALDQLKAHDPVTFEHWIGPFRSGGEIYLESQSDNCSTLSSTLGRAFRDYLSLFAKGAILDIGCGPHADPVYLKGYPRNQLSAVEPLDLAVEPEINVVQGVNEFLPWADNAFSTVVNATSIDHVLDLERSLEETRRVLQEDGLFVIWFANVDGSPDYTKIAPADRTPVDGAHLFHVSDDWFLPLMDRYFELIDFRTFQADPKVADVFAVYRPRKTIRTVSDTSPTKTPTKRRTKKAPGKATPAAKASKRSPTKKRASKKTTTSRRRTNNS